MGERSMTMEAEGAIRASNRRFEEAFARGDLQGVLSCYAEGATMFPPGSPPLIGREAIRAFLEAVREHGVERVTLETGEVQAAGDLAAETGVCAMFAGEQELDRGPYVVIWRREAGTWRMSRDIWNSSRPAEE